MRRGRKGSPAQHICSPSLLQVRQDSTKITCLTHLLPQSTPAQTGQVCGSSLLWAEEWEKGWSMFHSSTGSKTAFSNSTVSSDQAVNSLALSNPHQHGSLHQSPTHKCQTSEYSTESTLKNSELIHCLYLIKSRDSR